MKRAGVSRALFYRHYSSVNEVFDSVVDLVAQDFLARLEMEASDDTEAELDRVLRDFLNTCQAVRLPARALLRNSRLPGTDDSVGSLVFLRAEQEIYRRSGIEEPSALARLTIRTWLTCVEVQTLAWLEGEDHAETVDVLAATHKHFASAHRRHDAQRRRQPHGAGDTPTINALHGPTEAITTSE